MKSIGEDMEVFSRSLRLTYLFQHKQESFIHPFKKKTSYIPPQTKETTLEKYITDTSNLLQLHTNNPLKHTSNLTPEERKAIKTLKNNKEIIIKTADKGTKITVIDTQQYIREGIDFLQDPNTYTKLTEDPTPNLAARVTAYVHELHQTGHIDKIELQHILPPNPTKTPTIYFLRKIHKNPHQIRPIVTGINGPTANLSNFLDFFFKQQLSSIPSFLKNSSDLTAILNQTTLHTNHTPLLVSMDINSMYPTIPQDEAIEYLLQHSDPLPFSKITTKRLLNFVLKENYFSFNQTIYHQITGVAMGTPIAPTLACFFMHHIETSFFATQQLLPLIYKRYIDDIFLVWTHGPDTFQTFFNNFNSFHPKISFTNHCSSSSVDYLDLTIYIDPAHPTKIQYRPFHKATNSFQYVHASSHHPTNTKNAIIYSEALRHIRLTSDPTNIDPQLEHLKTHFRNRGYPTSTINKMFNKAKQHVPISTCQPDRIFFKTTFDIRRPTMKKLLTQEWDKLKQHPQLKTVHQKHIITCYKNSSNINKQLVRAALPQDVKTTPIPPCPTTYRIPKVTKPCRLTGCGTCNLLWCRNTISATSCYKKLNITETLSCTSKNVVYIIQCTLCNKQYVGQTSCMLRERVKKHRNKFQGNAQPRPYLYKHFDQHGWINFTITPIKSVPQHLLLQEETNTITELNTKIPHGLNSIFSINRDTQST